MTFINTLDAAKLTTDIIKIPILLTPHRFLFEETLCIDLTVPRRLLIQRCYMR